MTLWPNVFSPRLFPSSGVCSRLAERVAGWPPTAHSGRVALLAAAVSEHLGLSDEQVREACRAGLLHDLGKVFVPRAVRHKAGPLSAQNGSGCSGTPWTAPV